MLEPNLTGLWAAADPFSLRQQRIWLPRAHTQVRPNARIPGCTGDQDLKKGPCSDEQGPFSYEPDATAGLRVAELALHDLALVVAVAALLAGARRAARLLAAVGRHLAQRVAGLLDFFGQLA
jgi:hypothetical protein